MYIKFKVSNLILSALIIGKVQNGNQDTYILHSIPFISESGESLIAKSVDVTYTEEKSAAWLNYEAASIDCKSVCPLSYYTIEGSP